MITDKQIKEGFKKIAKSISELESHNDNPYAGSYRDGILHAIEDLGLLDEYNNYLKKQAG